MFLAVPTVTEAIATGQEAADIAISESTLALSESQQTLARVQEQGDTIAIIQTTIQNSTVLQTQVSDKCEYSDHNAELYCAPGPSTLYLINVSIQTTIQNSTVRHAQVSDKCEYSRGVQTPKL